MCVRTWFECNSCVCCAYSTLHDALPERCSGLTTHLSVSGPHDSRLSLEPPIICCFIQDWGSGLMVHEVRLLSLLCELQIGSPVWTMQGGTSSSQSVWKWGNCNCNLAWLFYLHEQWKPADLVATKLCYIPSRTCRGWWYFSIFAIQ